MEKVYSIEEILSAFNDFQSKNKISKSEIKEKIVSQVELNIPTYNKDDLPTELLSIEAVKPGSRNL